MKKFKVMLSVFMVLVIISLSVVPTLAVTIESLTRDVVDSELATLIKNSDKDKKIPVYIWYNDVSQNEIDTKVKEKTGLTESSLSTDLVMPDATLLNEIKNSGDNAENDMQAYLSKTQVARAKEKEITDTYIKTRRDYSRKAYKQKSDQIIDVANIPDSDIIFNSKYAPMIICELTASQIKKINSDTRIENIGYYEEAVTESCTENPVAITTNQVRLESELGLTGDGVEVGMVDVGYPATHDELDISKIELIGMPGVSSHATNTARVLVGNESGFAKDINLFSTDGDLNYIETMLTRGVKVINVSFGWPISETNTSSEYAYSIRDKWFDHIVAYHNVTVVASAGNITQYIRVTSPAMAHNVITVGAYNDKYSGTDLSDDQLNSSSRYKNENGTTASTGVEKPDVVMPCNVFDDNGGTSTAAPVLTAIVAQIIQLKPSLAAFPQAIKAIVMASCHRKVLSSIDGEEQETMEMGITERQGVGAPDAWTMACIVSQGTYGVGVMDGLSQIVYHNFVLPKYTANNINVSLNWLRNNECTGNDNPVVRSSVDLDLHVFDKEGYIIGRSELYYSSTEMAYLSLNSSNDRFKIGIINNDNDVNEYLRYGYAYSTDVPYMTPVSNDGIYFMKNKATGGYLNYDSTTQTVSVSNVFNPDTQQWIINELNQSYVLYPVDSVIRKYQPTDADTQKYLFPILTNDDYEDPYYEEQFLATPPDMWFVSYESNPVLDEGYFTLLTPGDTGSYGLACLGSNVVFSRGTGLAKFTDNMQWQLEKLHYRRGDCNADGAIDIFDVTALQYHLANYDVFTNKNMLLADINYDDVLSIADVTQIQKMIAN